MFMGKGRYSQNWEMLEIPGRMKAAAKVGDHSLKIHENSLGDLLGKIRKFQNVEKMLENEE